MSTPTPSTSGILALEKAKKVLVEPTYDKDVSYKICTVEPGATDSDPPTYTQIFTAYEEAAQQCYGCNYLRPLTVSIYNYEKDKDPKLSTPVIEFKRPFNCSQWCCFCCLQQVQVFSPPEIYIGKVQQEISCIETVYGILDVNNKIMKKMTGKYCICQRGTDIDFEIKTVNGTNNVVGDVSPQFDNKNDGGFVINYPISNLKSKIIQLAGGFLIYYMFYETNVASDKPKDGGEQQSSTGAKSNPKKT